VGLETFLEAGEEAALAEACGGGLEVRGVVERVALTLALLGEGAVATFAVAMAAAKEELGGEAKGAARDMTGVEGGAPEAAIWGGANKVGEEALGGVATCRCLLELRLLRGGVALRWAGVPAGVSSSIGEASEGGGAAATAAYEPGAEVCGIPVSSWEAMGGSVSMGVGGDSLVHLEIGGLAAVGGGPRKGRKLPSFLELAFFGLGPW